MHDGAHAAERPGRLVLHALHAQARERPLLPHPASGAHGAAPPAPAGASVQCAGDIPAAVQLTAQDDCSGAIHVSPADSAPVADAEEKGILREMLFDAQAKTKDEMVDLIQQLQQQGLTADQAHQRAWEMVREKYILLPPESNH